MAISRMKASFRCNVKKVWDVVTSLENYSWRSDISRIEVLDGGRFAEYTKGGYATNFKVTAEVPCERWEFDIENDNMSGHWTGLFTATEGGTEIEFTEEVTPKKLILKPFVKAYLKKQQAVYIEDLRKALE